MKYRSVSYALATVGYVAENFQDGLIKTATVSKHYSISMEYLHKILQELVKADVLKSKRGPTGGFSLARDSKEISMLQVIEAVDGPLVRPLPIAELAKNAKFSLKMEEICKKATETEMKVYDKAKLADMF